MAVDRNTPTTTSHPLGISGSAYATLVDETIAALWERIGGVLSNIGGTANAITADLKYSNGFTAYTDGFKCEFLPTANNTSAATIDIEGIGTRAIRRPNNDALSADDLQTGVLAELEYHAARNVLILMSAVEDTVAVTKTNYTYVDVIPATTNWIAPWKANVRWWVLAGGAAGAIREHSGARASGGGAGGSGVKEITVVASASYTCTIPAQAMGSSATGADGTNGGLASIVGPGINMVALGGNGGLADTANVLGGIGGSCTGGDKNWAGGNGGDASGSKVSTGGGACGITGDGYDALPMTSNDTAGDGASLGASTSVAKYNGVSMPPFALDGAKGGPGGTLGVDGVDGGMLCGGGAVSYNGAGVVAGHGGYGAGGGGCACLGSGTSGNGGPALIIVEYTGDIS